MQDTPLGSRERSDRKQAAEDAAFSAMGHVDLPSKPGEGMSAVELRGAAPSKPQSKDDVALDILRGAVNARTRFELDTTDSSREPAVAREPASEV